MTNVLKLFWQPEAIQKQQEKKALPLPQSKKRKQATLIEEEQDCEKVNYTCLKCGEQSEFGTSTSIQCRTSLAVCCHLLRAPTWPG